jgi:tetratricopeptide (TPR) repeat protein
VDDFDRALKLNADLTEAYVNRALAHEGMKDYAKAIADYTKALDAPTASTRVWFLRSAARDRAGDPDGAKRDFAKGLAAEPTDELSWIARGSARRESDPKGALADYEQALSVNPRSFDGLQNKAAILSDKFNKDAEALEVMEQAVKLYPESVLTRGGRGVLLARAGNRALAVADAQACLILDSGPATLYQVACIYALTSKQNANDRLQALPLLSAALRAGFGLEFVDHDTDLDPLRRLPEFQQLVAAARALHVQPAR